jgi:hypothetical protein
MWRWAQDGNAGALAPNASTLTEALPSGLATRTISITGHEALITPAAG